MNHAKTITREQMYNELRHADSTNYSASVADRACLFLVLTKYVDIHNTPGNTTDTCHIKTVPVILNVCSTCETAWEGSGVKFIQPSDYRA